VVSNHPGAAARLLAGEAGLGRAGITVPPGDAAALAAALAYLADDPAGRARLGRAGRQAAVRRWDRRLLAERFCATVERAGRAQPQGALAAA
jgi:glycosyltransferase involved in cell wall biosynthesis